MKPKIRLSALLMVGAIVSASLFACSQGTSPTDKGDVDGMPSKLPTENELISTYTAQIEHYESLIAELEDRLLKEKEEGFIEAAQYKQRIAELERSIQALSDKLSSPDTPVSGTLSSGYQDDIGEEKTAEESVGTSQSPAPPSNLAAVSPFETQRVDGGIMIIGYNGSDTELSVPSEIGGIPVVSIGEGAFKGKDIVRLILPEGIKEIDWFAFSGCESLCEILIPSSVKSIGHGAFDGCSGFLVIRCESGSYAEAFALSWGIVYVTK